MQDLVDKYFKTIQKQKREAFTEQVHAAYILNTSFSRFGKLEETRRIWVMQAYPGSTIETGQDQGGSYYTITPNF